MDSVVNLGIVAWPSKGPCITSWQSDLGEGKCRVGCDEALHIIIEVHGFHSRMGLN